MPSDELRIRSTVRAKLSDSIATDIIQLAKTCWASHSRWPRRCLRRSLIVNTVLAIMSRRAADERICPEVSDHDRAGLLAMSLALPFTLSFVSKEFEMLVETISGLLKGWGMADSSQNRTEQATPKRKAEARAKGQIALSRDAAMAIALLEVSRRSTG